MCQQCTRGNEGIFSAKDAVYKSTKFMCVGCHKAKKELSTLDYMSKFCMDVDVIQEWLDKQKKFIAAIELRRFK